MIDDADLASATRKLAQALRATDDLTAVTKNKDGEHLVQVTGPVTHSEILVFEGMASGFIDRIGSGVIKARVQRSLARVFLVEDLEGIIAYLRGE